MRWYWYILAGDVCMMFGILRDFEGLHFLYANYASTSLQLFGPSQFRCSLAARAYRRFHLATASEHCLRWDSFIFRFWVRVDTFWESFLAIQGCWCHYCFFSWFLFSPPVFRQPLTGARPARQHCAFMPSKPFLPILWEPRRQQFFIHTSRMMRV